MGNSNDLDKQLEKQVDLVIIGGGPAGLYGAFYAGLRDISVTLLEAQEELGGKLNFYPEKFVWDVGGLPPTKGKIIRENLIQQATTFEATIYTKAKAVQIKQEEQLFYVEDATGRIHPCRAILFAIGGGIVSPTKLELVISEELQSAIHYTFPSQKELRGKQILVSGGGDAAVDYANDCLKYAHQVKLIYRGNKLKAHETAIRNFQTNGGEILLNSEIHQIDKSHSGQLRLQLKNQMMLEADHLLVQHGHERDSSFLETLEFSFAKEQDFYFSCEEPTKTNVEGIYAAGDIQFSKGKLYLLAGAFQDAATSINQIKQYLAPESSNYAMVSSHNHKFDQRNDALIE
ncbi:ferredoxin/flavodoxin-NADP+ reductase [Enterococcus sp. AZ194]|uniref:NAD(P)/FAD-dependent oxidoreductase n=1 Tax=Enterococcus sp. AZ194 TaxID=2774629 RepID=UPI003F1F22B7